jgi:RNA polymerase sigma-70 factor (ECF subfamily)
MYAIARYKLVDHLRRTRASMNDISIESASEVVAHNDSEAIESGLDLEKLLARLPPKMKQAIQYVKLEGLSVRETARRTGMSESSVKVSVHRGLKTVARLIRKERLG